MPLVHHNWRHILNHNCENYSKALLRGGWYLVSDEDVFRTQASDTGYNDGTSYFDAPK